MEQPVQLTLTPDTVTEEGQTFGHIGVMYQTPFESAPLQAIPNAAINTYDVTVQIFKMLGMLVTGQFSIDDLSGPVGIYKTY